MPHVALALMAHPDDAEILCAGALIQISRQNDWSVVIATMTPGDCGSSQHTSEEISRIRIAEAQAAAQLMGAAYHCVGLKDLRVFYDDPTLGKVTRFLRQIRPTLILTHSPEDYHVDHEATSRLVRAAAFAAPVPLFLNGADEPPPLEHVPHLYYCDPVDGTDIFGRPVDPAIVVNVENEIELKTEMLARHSSQREWLRLHHGIDQYLDALRKWSANRGTLIDAEFGEGFRQHLGHGYPQVNLLKSLCAVFELNSLSKSSAD